MDLFKYDSDEKVDFNREKKKVKNQKINNNDKKDEINNITTNHNDSDDNISNDEEEGIYIYYDENKNKKLYCFHKISTDKQFSELRCIDRRNCGGRARYNIEKKEISIIKESTLVEYEMHNYIKEQIIIEKIKQNKVSNEEMKNPLFQKFYFLETFLNYPHLTYN